MSQPKDHSARKITFSWEKKPGVSKVTSETLIPEEEEFLAKLPPPPCTPEEATPKNHVHNFQIPLPPCAFQPPFYRTSSKRGLWFQDRDPFLAAFKECTKNQKSGNKVNKKFIKHGIESRVRKSMSFFSCTRSCTVHDTNLLRISHLDDD
ncbi:uncharacterized protein LOC114193677 [Vigna unguiculata]|uniref:Uncharacterized protein n=1 Tax=Vigna unguiculata TaxID=3917 RepID=A0A4D6MDL1_VIGUN|nr:uncharacterized protein LOC114193677 [Vigna unguiculata]QCD99057.1 hypothetical protein DEO72_LG7g336 [Vigna unguiculata]